MNSRIVYGLCGILAAILFIIADASGALLQPDYSVIGQAISELIERGAPNKSVLDPLILCFHALVIPFACGLHMHIAASRRGILGPLLLGIAGTLGIVLTLFFPCDPGCEPLQSVRGTMHIFIAIPMGFSVLFAILAFSFRFRGDEWWARFSVYSVVTFVTGVLLAAITVVAARTSLVGLFERALTVSYLQWYVVVGAALIRYRNGKPTDEPQSMP